MQLINWYNLFANALWVFALALALATLGFARWEAFRRGEKTGAALNRTGYQAVLNLAGVLFSLGLAATTQKVWEWALWLGMAALFGGQIGVAVWLARKSSAVET